MSLEKSLDDLKAAFDAVAHEIEGAYPRVWGKAQEMYGNDARASVQFLIASHAPGFGDKSLLDVAQENEQDAVDYIEAVMAGVYM